MHSCNIVIINLYCINITYLIILDIYLIIPIVIYVEIYMYTYISLYIYQTGYGKTTLSSADRKGQSP